MVWAVAAGRNISDPQQSPESVIVQTVGSQEVLVLVISSASPEVADLLGLDVAASERRAWQCWRGHLKNGQRRCVTRQRLSNPRNCRNQGGQRDLRCSIGEACQRGTKREPTIHPWQSIIGVVRLERCALGEGGEEENKKWEFPESIKEKSCICRRPMRVKVLGIAQVGKRRSVHTSSRPFSCRRQG